MKKPYPTDLSDAEWKYIQPHLPAPTGHGLPRTHDLREILDAVFYLPKSGCQWRLLPHDFPRWPTVYHYFAGPPVRPTLQMSHAVRNVLVESVMFSPASKPKLLCLV